MHTFRQDLISLCSWSWEEQLHGPYGEPCNPVPTLIRQVCTNAVIPALCSQQPCCGSAGPEASGGTGKSCSLLPPRADLAPVICNCPQMFSSHPAAEPNPWNVFSGLCWFAVDVLLLCLTPTLGACSDSWHHEPQDRQGVKERNTLEDEWDSLLRQCHVWGKQVHFHNYKYIWSHLKKSQWSDYEMSNPILAPSSDKPPLQIRGALRHRLKTPWAFLKIAWPATGRASATMPVILPFSDWHSNLSSLEVTCNSIGKCHVSKTPVPLRASLCQVTVLGFMRKAVYFQVSKYQAEFSLLNNHQCFLLRCVQYFHSHRSVVLLLQLPN